MPLCFDLDGTLGSFGGGYALLRQALGELWGEEPSAEELRRCQGSTDWEIVEEMHRAHFNRPLDVEAYEAYERACLARFEAAFGQEGRLPEIHTGLVEGVNTLFRRGHPVYLVSGNAPSVLDFKSGRLGIDARIPRLGSLPHHSRSMLIRRALASCPGPHLYVGDRPHDRAAAEEAGVPFLGIGEQVPGDHPLLDTQAEARCLVEAVEGLLAAR